MDRQELISLKRKQIKLLKDEIRILEGGTIGSNRTKPLIYDVHCEREKDGSLKLAIDERESSVHPAWETIRNLSTMFYMDKDTKFSGICYHVSHFKKKQKDLTPKQILLSAQFCDEVIDIYNKYVVKANPVMDFDGIVVTPWDHIGEHINTEKE